MNRLIKLGMACWLLAAGALSVAWGQEAKVDLNTATLKQLVTLPGVGPATAERIIEFRTQNGPFKKIEDLMNVRGIGEKRFLRLKDLIKVGGQDAAPAQPRPAAPRSSQ